MNDLKIIGKQRFLGTDIPVIEGGFGENEKCMLAKTIADIHEIRLDKVNDLIKSNIDEFEVGIDILDMKNSNLGEVSLLEVGFTKQSIANSSNIYLLSEQGYMLLVSFMKTDAAKAIRKVMRRQYFKMREIVKSESELFESKEDYLIYQLQEQKKIKENINDLDDRTSKIEDKIDDLPLLAADSSELTTTAKRKVVGLLGGKNSNAYKALGRKAFKSMYKELHQNFDVNKICSIKRKDLGVAKQVVADYKLPICLAREIEKANNQLSLVV